MAKVPFLDLRVQDAEERSEIIEAIETILDHGRILLGPEVSQIESQVARRLGRAHAVGCNSGTDALLIALKALNIGPGDEVIVPALSFIATANAVSLTGATPIFADLNEDLNISPDSIARLVTRSTKCIVPVHWAGLPCDMEEITKIAKQSNLFIVEDGSQAFDASYFGKKVGTFGEIGCFSMNSMKGLASLGEAGMLACDNPELNERCIALRYHGLVNREFCENVAQNSRLDTIQAAVLLVRLRRLSELIEKRRNNADILSKKLERYVTVPREAEGKRHVYYTYTIQTDRRNELQEYLTDRGIETKIQHPLLMSEHPVYAGQARGEWAAASQLIKKVLCLPANEKVRAEELDYISETIIEFYHS